MPNTVIENIAGDCNTTTTISCTEGGQLSFTHSGGQVEQLAAEIEDLKDQSAQQFTDLKELIEKHVEAANYTTCNATTKPTIEVSYPLKPGSKIGTKMITASDPEKIRYGSLGVFLQRTGDDIFLLTNGHVVGWTLGQAVYLYIEDTAGHWSSKMIGKVSKTTKEKDVEEGLDAAAVKIDEPANWAIDYKVNGIKLEGDGTGPAVEGSKTWTFGAKTGEQINSTVRDIDANWNPGPNGEDIKHVIQIAYKNKDYENKPGDSGSVIIQEDNSKVVGLYFGVAVSDNRYIEKGYGCHIQSVLDFLGKGGAHFTVKTK